MYRSQPYRNLLIASVLFWVVFIGLNEVIPQKVGSTDTKNLPEEYMMIEGYVVSKRWDSMWVADEPVSFMGRVSGFFLSDYGSVITIVSKHNDTLDQHLFRPVKVNQKVRIYGDYLIESNPGSISAYSIELVEE